MPVDVPVTDVPEDSSPSATDHDFVSFVRSTLSALNTKMDNLLSNQAAFESKLEAIERRVTINTTVTTELSRATEFNLNTIKDQQTVIDSLQKSLAALAQDNVSMSSSLNTPNAKISRSERHSRSFNVRFLGVPEQDGENCVKLAEKLLLDKFHVGGSPIENAHRTGKAVQSWTSTTRHRSVLQPGNEDGRSSHGASETERHKDPDRRRPYPGRPSREEPCSPIYGRTIQTTAATIFPEW